MAIGKGDTVRIVSGGKDGKPSATTWIVLSLNETGARVRRSDDKRIQRSVAVAHLVPADEGDE